MAATNNPAKAAAKPAATLPAQADEDEDDVLQITSGTYKPGRRVVIFYIDGKPHSVPEDPPAIVTINYLDAVRRSGAAAASTYMLEAMFGPESYLALTTCKDITTKQLALVIEKVAGILNAADEGPKDDS